MFRERIEKLKTLVEKEEAFHREIADLRKVDLEKRTRGIHVTEEYEQAKKIYKTKVAFHKAEVKPLQDELNAMWKGFKAENSTIQDEKTNPEDLEAVMRSLHK